MPHSAFRVASPQRGRPGQPSVAHRAIRVPDYVDFALAEPHLFDTAFTPTSACPDRPDDPSAWQVLFEGVGELVEADALRPAAADEAALIAWSGVHGIASILVRKALIEPLTDDTAVDVVLDGVMRAIESL